MGGVCNVYWSRLANELDRERLRNFRGETETEIVRNSKVLVDFEVRTWIPKKSRVAAEPRSRFRPSIWRSLVSPTALLVTVYTVQIFLYFPFDLCYWRSSTVLSCVTTRSWWRTREWNRCSTSSPSWFQPTSGRSSKDDVLCFLRIYNSKLFEHVKNAPNKALIYFTRLFPPCDWYLKVVGNEK